MNQNMVLEPTCESSSISGSGGREMTSKAITSFNHNILVKLDDNNFLWWKQQVHPVIKGLKLQSYIQSSKSAPQKFNSKEEKDLGVYNDKDLDWEQQDQLLLSWLFLSMSDSITRCMVGYEHSNQIWE